MQPAPPPPVLVAGDAQAIPTWRAAWSDRTGALMAALCELAYADRATVANGVRGAGFRICGWYDLDGLTAFLAVNPAEMAVLVFRGTADRQGWADDLDALRIPLPGHPDVEVHAGFWHAWDAMAAAIHAGVDALPPDLGLYVAGHSLGGAMAQLAAMALERDTLAACYTFGSPRLATAGFDALLKTEHYRVVHEWDLVPAVPPATPWGYAHSGDPRLLSSLAPACALRRDRGLVARVLVDLWSLVVWQLTGRFAAVDDHMIWKYRAALQGVAALRSAP